MDINKEAERYATEAVDESKVIREYAEKVRRPKLNRAGWDVVPAVTAGDFRLVCLLPFA